MLRTQDAVVEDAEDVEDAEESVTILDPEMPRRELHAEAAVEEAVVEVAVAVEEPDTTVEEKRVPVTLMEESAVDADVVVVVDAEDADAGAVEDNRAMHR